jgi:hypothetical protein
MAKGGIRKRLVNMNNGETDVNAINVDLQD